MRESGSIKTWYEWNNGWAPFGTLTLLLRSCCSAGFWQSCMRTSWHWCYTVWILKDKPKLQGCLWIMPTHCGWMMACILLCFIPTFFEITQMQQRMLCQIFRPPMALSWKLEFSLMWIVLVITSLVIVSSDLHCVCWCQSLGMAERWQGCIAASTFCV